MKDSIEYCGQQFLFDSENSEQVWAKRRLDKVVLYFESREKEAYFCIDLEYRPEILDSYPEKEDEPRVFTGDERLNRQYANKIKISRVLKAFQKDWETKQYEAPDLPVDILFRPKWKRKRTKNPRKNACIMSVERLLEHGIL